MKLRTALVAAVAVSGVTAGIALAPSASAATWETVIDNSFVNYQAFESEFNYLYPWGSDHNGSARMYAGPGGGSHAYLEGGNVLTLKANRITWDEGNSTANPKPKIYYHSGAVHAKEQIVVNDKFPNWEVRGDFRAPSARGTWPAFWLAGAWSWPPEIDILEYKGDNRNWFNTFRTAKDVSNTIVSVSSPGSWHTYKAWITKVSATDVEIHYSIDGEWKGTHRANFVGKPMWLIINLQMEGSSGAPGPREAVYQARNVYVGRSRA